VGGYRAYSWRVDAAVHVDRMTVRANSYVFSDPAGGC
jgi:hypothetical protein